MLTQRDVQVATAAVKVAAAEAAVPLVDDQAYHIAVAVIGAVDQSRSPVTVGRDVLENLLKPVV